MAMLDSGNARVIHYLHAVEKINSDLKGRWNTLEARFGSAAMVEAKDNSNFVIFVAAIAACSTLDQKQRETFLHHVQSNVESVQRTFDVNLATKSVIEIQLESLRRASRIVMK